MDLKPSLRDLLKRPSFRNAISLIAALYIRLVYATVRWRYVGWENVDRVMKESGPIIPLLWHGRLLIGPKAWRSSLPINVLISRHGDGDLIARTVSRLGFSAVRGSSERADRERGKGGAAALRQMLRLLQQDISVAVTPDGPRGPRMRLSRGVVELARLSGAPLVPVSYATKRRRILRSWDRFHLPLPFSSGVIIYGTPIRLRRDLDEVEREDARLQIEAALNDVTHEADRLAGHVAVEPAVAPGPSMQERRA